MQRLVFFGVDGPFSALPLEALVRGDLPPLLVVHGMERSNALRPTVDRHRARPGLLGRLHVKTKSPLIEEANHLGIDVIDTDDANCAAVMSAIEKLRPDAFVIAGFPHLLSKALLSRFRIGGLNLHPGRLPAERGAAPLFWALKAGRTTIGWTLHMVDEREDAGDVVASGEISFTPGLDGQQVLRRCAEAALPYLMRSVRALLAGDLVRIPQSHAGVGRCPRPAFQDGKIDAGRPAEAVFTFVGGCASGYSVFAECGGDRFFIKRPVSYDPNATLAFEYVLTGDRLILRCNPGVVELELKEEGALFTAEYS